MKIEAQYGWSRFSGRSGLPLPAVAFSTTWFEGKEEMELQVIVPDSWLRQHGFASAPFDDAAVRAIFEASEA